MSVTVKDNDGDLQTATKPKQQKARYTRTEVIFRCNQCLMTFKSFIKLQTHCEKSHDTEVGRDSKEHYSRLHHCKLCNKDFDDADESTRHLNKHSHEIHKVCDICGKVFTVRGSWHRHLRHHEAIRTDKRLQCKLCGKTFTLIGNLKSHMNFHSKERPHICEVCGKGFKDRHGVVKHLKTHFTVKPHSCQVCGKGFAQLYNMKTHLRTHTGEKPFKCNLCNLAFAHKGTLTGHMKTAHGVDTRNVQAVQEFDDINISDPKMYENCTIKIASTEGSNDTVRSSHVRSEKSGGRTPIKSMVTHHDESQTSTADTNFDPQHRLSVPVPAQTVKLELTDAATSVTQGYSFSSHSVQNIDSACNLESTYSASTDSNDAKGNNGISYTTL